MTWWDGGIDLSPYAGSAPLPTAGTYINNSSAEIYDAYSGTWSTWIPTRTNVTVGNGTETARCFSIGGRVHLLWSLTLGTTSAIGSLPRLEFASYSNYTGITAGVVGCYDTTAALWYPVAGHGVNTDEFQLEVNATYPFTWATGDVLSASWTVTKTPPTTTIGV